MYIFQPDRFLLKEHILQVSHYIKGKTLDVGAGEYARYDKLFPNVQCTRMDVNHGESIDVVGSADSIPFNDNFFDSVVCTQVFEHLSDPFKSAGEIFRVLKTGGYAVITVPQVNELHEEPHDYFRYTKFGLKEMFESKGFLVIDCIQRGGYFTMMSQLRTRYLIDKFSLYKRKFLGRIISKALLMHSKFGMWLDSKDDSVANKKNTIGWTVVIQKPYENSNSSR